MAPMPRSVFHCRPTGLVAGLGLLVLFVVFSGCPSDKKSGPTSPGDDAGIQIVNGTGLPVTGTLSGPGFDPVNISLGPMGFEPIEIPGAAGDLITLTVIAPGYATGSSGCNLSEEVIAGYPDVYAQLTIATPGSAGQPMVVICSSGWQ